jgi:murein L,D-transpeptidase YafK
MTIKNSIVCFVLLTLFCGLFFSVNTYASVPVESSPTSDAELSFDSDNKTDSEESLADVSTNSDVTEKLAKIPDSIVSMSSGYVVVVDKSVQRLYVFHKSEHFSKVFDAPCSTGKNSGSKQIAGDAKTPNGIFFITKVLHKPGPPEVYGSMAFPLDYPTLSDQRAGRGGNNIWIHGTTNALLPKQSRGCVVLRERDLRRLANYIFLNRTPVIISESIKWVPQNYVSSSKKYFENILESWNRAFLEKDLKKIDSLYMQGTEIKGKRREDLHNKIKNLKLINNHFVLQPKDISILQSGNHAVIIFDQVFSVSSNNSFQGFYNKLILEKMNNQWHVVDDATPSRIEEKHLARANNRQKEIVDTDKTAQKEIQKLVKQWVVSWESGDMATYRNCYTEDFQSREMNLNEWVLYKTDVRQRSKNIKIKIDNLKISVKEETGTALFIQSYSSSALKSKGKKTLELKKMDGEWKIHREIM